MANATVAVTQAYTKPYITLQEYKDSPSGTSVSSLIKGGTQQAQDAALTAAILRGSAWIDETCQQPLWARSMTEQKTATVGKDGLKVMPNCFPMSLLTAFSYGYDPMIMTALTDVSVCYIEPRKITLSPYYATNFNGLQDRRTSLGKVYALYTYVHGFVNTTILAATAGVSSLIPVDVTGIYAGQTIRVIDGANSEDVVVASSYVAGASPVPLVNVTIYAHANGVSFSAMPSGIKEACVLATATFLKQRGDGALQMGLGSTPTKPSKGSGTANPQLDLAASYLKNYIRRF